MLHLTLHPRLYGEFAQWREARKQKSFEQVNPTCSPNIHQSTRIYNNQVETFDVFLHNVKLIIDNDTGGSDSNLSSFFESLALFS